MDFKDVFTRILPYWTLLNLGLAGLSVVSAIIIYITRTLFPVTESLLQFTVISIVNMVFLLYWSLWFLVAAPPIIGSLWISRKEPNFYRYAVQNTAAVVVLYILKILFGFDVFAVAV